MDKTKPIAHLRLNDEGVWIEHDLKDHLVRVAEKAAGFASEFSNEDWALAAGLLHDLGKYNPLWQEYLRRHNGDYSEDAYGQD
jgi:CRISPR-associated endonuclease/helicase Cas3